MCTLHDEAAIRFSPTIRSLTPDKTRYKFSSVFRVGRKAAELGQVTSHPASCAAQLLRLIPLIRATQISRSACLSHFFLSL